MKNSQWRSEMLEGTANINTRRNTRVLLAALDQHFNPFRGTESALQLIRFIRQQETLGNAPQTIRLKVSTLKRVIQFAMSHGIRDDNPVVPAWGPKGKISLKPKCPDKAELDSLKKVLNGQSGFVAARDKAIIAFMRFEGLRIFEVTNLKHEHFEQHQKQTSIKVAGKGGFLTQVQLWPQTIKIVGEYLQYIPRDLRRGHFFIPEFKPGKKMDTRSIRKRCEHLFKIAGWRKGLNAHSLRHLLATELIENGLPITDAQRKLRHRFVSSTFNYYSNVPSLRNPEKLETAHKFLGDL